MVFALLAPGNYKIEVQAQGFEAALLNDLKVEVTKVTVANAKMQIGQVSTQVTVSEAALQVDTSTATTGDVMTGTQIRNIPLPTRNFLRPDHVPGRRQRQNPKRGDGRSRRAYT